LCFLIYGEQYCLISWFLLPYDGSSTLRYEEPRVCIHKHAPTYSEVDLRTLPTAAQGPRKMSAEGATDAERHQQLAAASQCNPPALSSEPVRGGA